MEFSTPLWSAREYAAVIDDMRATFDRLKKPVTPEQLERLARCVHDLGAITGHGSCAWDHVKRALISTIEQERTH